MAPLIVQVLDRLGTLHLIRQSLLMQMTIPDTSFTLGPAHAQILAKTKVCFMVI